MLDEIQQQILAIKLKRIQELNNRLRETIKRDRIPASIASGLYVYIYTHQ